MLWQTLNQVVECQPQTPTMVIKRYGKDDCRWKKKPEHLFVVDTQHQQPEKAQTEDDQFGSDDVCEDCANKKPFFSFEQRTA